MKTFCASPNTSLKSVNRASAEWCPIWSARDSSPRPKSRHAAVPFRRFRASRELSPLPPKPSRISWKPRPSSMAALLDVNALIALVDSDHVGHSAMQKWFLKHHRSGWATCPLTENGMVRVLSQPAYPSGQRSPAEVIQILHALKQAFEDSHRFWSD